jgi:adenylate cyclase
LTRLFVVATLALGLAGGALFAASYASSEEAILARSHERRDAVARRVEARVESELEVASQEIDDLERSMQHGVTSADDAAAIEARLFADLLDHPTLSDVTLTRGGQGGLVWQVSVFRTTPDPASEVWTRRIRREDGALVSEVRRRPRGGSLLAVAFAREPGTPEDPTKHATYEVTASPANAGRTVWSDLSYSELDRALPAAERRIVVTAQKTVDDVPGHFAGVVRAGILGRTIDELPRMGADDVDPGAPARAFLCDPRGRLLTRLAPGDPVVVLGDDLRVVPASVPPEVAAALAHPDATSLRFEAGGTQWRATFRPVPHTQDWRVGIVAPETYYTRDLRALRDRFLAALAALAAVALLAGALVLRPLRRSLARVVAATARMRRFDLTPTPADAPLREVAEVMEGVERAKTSMRALGHYVPLDLVRQLHAANEEPRLGGELVELSLMFTDIEGFTSLAERLDPDALARALGAYLEAMTGGVRSTEGTLDKFIGDAVMAFWNAPLRAEDHALRACRAVLACRKATRALYASPAWEGRAPLVTRYGLHTGRVMVGHFGAPERFSYTALGDGVNLAARLESLCRHYGVVTLASEAVVQAVGSAMAFRLVDKVAVKGKRTAVRVYELLEAPRPELRVYEEAFAAYLGRDFARVKDLLQALPDDPPSRVLAERCDAMLGDAPPPDWDGVYVARTK